MKQVFGSLAALSLAAASPVFAAGPVELGQPSISLRVKDIRASNEFYRKLGFEKLMGDIDQKWLILQNKSNGSVIGIFQDDFKETFILTFNPKDVRGIQKSLKQQGVRFEEEAKGAKGPAHASLKDPDGNKILLDQHGE